MNLCLFSLFDPDSGLVTKPAVHFQELSTGDRRNVAVLRGYYEKGGCCFGLEGKLLFEYLLTI